MRSIAPATCLSLALSLALCGCSVKAPPRQTWSLSGGLPGVAPQLVPDGPALGVLRFTAASEARTTALTWRDADGHLVHDTSDSWVDYPDRMLEEMALARLARAGWLSSVTLAPPRQGLDAVLSCRLVEFGEWNAAGLREARVALRWQLDAPGGEVIAAGEAHGTARVGEETMTAVVRAHHEAAEAALGDLQARLYTALASSKRAR